VPDPASGVRAPAACAARTSTVAMAVYR